MPETTLYTLATKIMRYFPLSLKGLQLNRKDKTSYTKLFRVPLENKYLEITMQDDKYVVRCEQLHLISESDKWCYISQAVASEQFPSSCIQNRGVPITQLLAELGQF